MIFCVCFVYYSLIGYFFLGFLIKLVVSMLFVFYQFFFAHFVLIILTCGAIGAP